MPDDSRKLLWTADELKDQERAVTQRLNPNSHLLRTGLSRLAGLQRAHVSLGRIPPGKDSFAYHAHMVEEEWVYVLSGAGDFMGFPTPSIAHLLRNPFDEHLVYLMGGESVPLDVLDYPTLGKRFLLHYTGGPPDFYELGEPVKPFGLADPPKT
jgi:uncharacterized cupin superfamily protein